MYLIESMLDRALPDGEAWPSEAHRTVASIVLLGNPKVVTMDGLRAGVEAVIGIPQDRIKTITTRELITDFQFPEGFIPPEVMA